MAGAALEFVVKTIGDLLIEEARFLSDVKGKVGRLPEELRAMDCFLEDAAFNRGEMGKRVKNLVAEVRNAAHEAQDLVELFALEEERSRRSQRGFIGKFICCICLPRRLLALHDFGIQIDSLWVKIEDIQRRRSTYGIPDLIAGDGARSHSGGFVRRRPILHSSSQDVVGMEDEKQAIVAQLLSERVMRRAVVSIVGMGGLGKTTLAKKVYNDPRIQNYFHRAVWIDVSQQYKDEELLQDLLLQAMGIRSDDRWRKREAWRNMKKEELEEELRNSLREVRYLIVMDDVWDEEVWQILGPHLPDEGHGSRVLITTRDDRVARAADPSTRSHQLRFLDGNESWELFLKKAFPEEDVEVVDGRRTCPVGFEEVGKRLVAKCGGLPLALTVLGGLLSRNPSVRDWRRVERTWQESGDGIKCKEILWLSYVDLPLHLKWCFLYFGAFPEDMKICVQKLIRLWIAEGFIMDMDREDITLEESAEWYLEELVQRCLVQVVDRSPSGGITSCRIHDLLHDFSIEQAKELNFLICRRTESQSSLPYSTLRRLSLHAAPEKFLSPYESTPTPSLRTLLGFKFNDSFLDFPVGGMQLIRVIDLQGAWIRVLPEQVGDMANLRYLGLRDTKLDSMPASVERLSRLQFLDLWMTFIEKVPSAVWRIETLREVIFSWGVEPEGIHLGSLRNLQVLQTVKAGIWINNCLAKLTSLRTLHLVNVTCDHHAALSAALPGLSRLTDLEVQGDWIPESLLTLSFLRDLRSLALSGKIKRATDSPRTQHYQWPERLSTLTLFRTNLRNPLPSLSKLSELRSLFLTTKSYNARNIKWQTLPCGTFPELQMLEVHHLTWVEEWHLKNWAKSLKSLRIRHCGNLDMLPQWIQELAGLKDLHLFSLSVALKTWVEIEQTDDNGKLRHVASIYISLIHGRVVTIEYGPKRNAYITGQSEIIVYIILFCFSLS